MYVRNFTQKKIRFFYHNTEESYSAGLSVKVNNSDYVETQLLYDYVCFEGERESSTVKIKYPKGKKAEPGRNLCVFVYFNKDTQKLDPTVANV